jgi:hypothetical protein
MTARTAATDIAQHYGIGMQQLRDLQFRWGRHVNSIIAAIQSVPAHLGHCGRAVDENPQTENLLNMPKYQYRCGDQEIGDSPVPA